MLSRIPDRLAWTQHQLDYSEHADVDHVEKQPQVERSEDRYSHWLFGKREGRDQH